MVKPGALLLLLAVVASPVDLTSGPFSMPGCPIFYYGQSSAWGYVEFYEDSSFSVCFTTQATSLREDCLLFQDGGGADSFSSESIDSQTVAGSSLHSALPNILTTSECFVKIFVNNGDTLLMTINVYDFGPQAAVGLITETDYTPANLVVEAVSGDLPLDSWSFSNAESQGSVYMDISGCRDEGDILLADSITIHSDICSTVTCDAAAVLDTEDTCTSPDVCLGNNVCGIPPIVCTVIGSTVIDFFNRAYTIPDRCAYTLTSDQNGLTITAFFRERRRKDVPFLDELMLQYPVLAATVTVNLRQGGAVLVNGDLLTLTATALPLMGVEFSKDDDRVTVKMLDYDMTVFFNGNTAHLSGPTQSLYNLCGSTLDPDLITSTNDEESFRSDYGCGIDYDDVDSMVDCSITTAACNLMSQAPFTACHAHIDPQPYIDACVNTSCTYSDVDGLICQYLEAYAVSCGLRTSFTLEDWRSAAGCAAVLQDSCRDQYCSYHEFCGENLGETRCLCRALFAANYTDTNNTLGDPVNCIQNSATVALAACLLWGEGIDYSSLHLNDPDCIGVIDSDHFVIFSFESSTCGTLVMNNNNNNNIVFKNTIMTRNTSSESDINRHDRVEIDFSCFHTQPEIRNIYFSIADSSVVQHIESGVWNYTLLMTAFTDPAYLHLLEPGYPVVLGQRIWLLLESDELDDNRVVMVTNFCWATNQPSSDDDLLHNLIDEGCPFDETVIMEGNGLGTSNYFSFSMFDFYGEDANMYLHCEVELCPKDPSCVPDCGGGLRKRRSSRSEYADGNPALITMVWNK